MRSRFQQIIMEYYKLISNSVIEFLININSNNSLDIIISNKSVINQNRTITSNRPLFIHFCRGNKRDIAQLLITIS